MLAKAIVICKKDEVVTNIVLTMAKLIKMQFAEFVHSAEINVRIPTRDLLCTTKPKDLIITCQKVKQALFADSSAEVNLS